MKQPFYKRHDVWSAVDFAIVLTLLVFTGIWAWREYMSSPPYVDPERFPVRGIDISAHNGMLNFESLADQGIEFVFLKATEGADYRDTNFRLNYEKARKAGLKIGVYHYFRFDKDGIDQAIHFMRTIGDRELDLGVAVDVEDEGNAKGVATDTIKKRLRDMVDYLNLEGLRVVFYTNRDGYYDYLHPEMEGMPLWICSFNEDPINADFTFWQYSHSGRLKGVNGKIDLNAFGGSREEWRQYLLDAKRVSHKQMQ